MFDNHTFAKVEGQTKAALVARAAALFEKDSCGSLFVRDELDGTLSSLGLDGWPRRRILHKDIEKWADAILAERSFRTLMV